MERETWRKADKLDIYSRLDYQKGLTSQNPNSKFKVLYNTSGTYLVSCVIDNGQRPRSTHGLSLQSPSVIAESTSYFYDTDDEEEALYICAFLNSPIIDKLVKPMQSRGLFGERHIHKKVLELPIPKFNPENLGHKRLIELARRCQSRISSELPELSKGLTGIGRIRQLVKEELEPEIEEIDRLVRRILVEEGVSARGLDDFS